MKVVIKAIRVLLFRKLAIVNFLGRFNTSLELNLLKSIQFDPAQKSNQAILYLHTFFFCLGAGGGGGRGRC